jgi:hypothetical protein
VLLHTPLLAEVGASGTMRWGCPTQTPACTMYVYEGGGGGGGNERESACVVCVCVMGGVVCVACTSVSGPNTMHSKNGTQVSVRGSPMQ